MIFYLVRHGEIESNIRKVYVGWSEEALTEKGVLQAEEAVGGERGKGKRKNRSRAKSQRR